MLYAKIKMPNFKIRLNRRRKVGFAVGFFATAAFASIMVFNVIDNKIAVAAQSAAVQNLTLPSDVFLLPEDVGIVFDGTNYINTGFSNISNANIFADFQYVRSPGINASAVYGVLNNENSTSNGGFFFQAERNTSTNQVNFTANASNGTKSESSALRTDIIASGDTDRHQIKQSISGSNFISTEFITDGAMVAKVNSGQSGNISTPSKILLGGIGMPSGLNNNGLTKAVAPYGQRGFRGVIYGFKISSNGEEVLNYKPAVRCINGDPVYGFMDEVSGNFMTAYATSTNQINPLNSTEPYTDCSTVSSITVSSESNTSAEPNVVSMISNNNFVSGSDSVTVNSETITGYNLFIESTTTDEDNTNNMINSAISRTISSVESTKESPSPLGVNQWGFAIAKNDGGLTGNNFNNDYLSPNAQSLFAEVPTPGDPELIRSTDSPTGTSGDTINVVYGVNTDSSLPQAVYSRNVVYVAVANAVPGGAPIFSYANSIKASAFLNQYPSADFPYQTDEEYLLTLVNANDEEDGNCLNAISTCKLEVLDKGGFDKSTIGTYTIKYMATDSTLNKSIFTIKVEVWNFTKIASGQQTVYALGSNGSVWSMGSNSYSARGINTTQATTASNSAPIEIQSEAENAFNGLPIVDIAGGSFTGCALNSAGEAFCWGFNNQGSLGINSTSTYSLDYPVAVRMPNGVTFTSISGSQSDNYFGIFGAIGSDGNIYTWGNNNLSNLGDGTTVSRAVPTKITDSGNFVQLDQGNVGGVALTNTGEVYVWGNNRYGQLGPAGVPAGVSNPIVSTPKIVSGLPYPVKTVNYGGYDYYGFISVVDVNGDAYGWGWNSVYQFGSGVANASVTVPTLANTQPLPGGIETADNGSDFTCYVANKTPYCTGYANNSETLQARVETTNGPAITRIPVLINNTKQVLGSYDNTWVLSLDGTVVYGVGASNRYQLGVPSTASALYDAVPWGFTPPNYR